MSYRQNRPPPSGPIGKLPTSTFRLPDDFSSAALSSFSLPAGWDGSWPRTLMLCSSLNWLISSPFFVICSFPSSISFSSCALLSSSWGSTTSTVCSTSTPPISRKHFLLDSTVFTRCEKCEKSGDV
uniref:Uncharacterized protein n=1 Tax=Anopheles merus TaxID=30066 RepID=A0A182UMW0_ANOME